MGAAVNARELPEPFGTCGHPTCVHRECAALRWTAIERERQRTPRTDVADAITHECPPDESKRLLDAFEAAATAAAYRAAADLAEDVANELFDAYDTEQGNGAMAVAARLRARADHMEQQ